VAEVVLVEHEGGGADLLGDPGDAHPAHLDRAVLGAAGGAGPQAVDQGVDVAGVGQPRGGRVVAVEGTGFVGAHGGSWSRSSPPHGRAAPSAPWNRRSDAHAGADGSARRTAQGSRLPTGRTTSAQVTEGASDRAGPEDEADPRTG